MTRQCEVCESLGRRPSEKHPRKIRRLLLDERMVLLCEPHVERARAAGVETLEQLRRLFREKKGRRSLISRRSPLDRRIFPARPEGRRRSGRRQSDAAPSE